MLNDKSLVTRSRVVSVILTPYKFPGSLSYRAVVETTPIAQKEYFVKGANGLYIRIGSLNAFQEGVEYFESYRQPRFEEAALIGIPTGGSISIDGSSAIRRSCSLTLVQDTIQYPGPINPVWSLETEFELAIKVETMAPSGVVETKQFNQGHFIITQFTYNEAITGRRDINISGQDKMCLLNGEIDGKIPYETDFGNYDYVDENKKTNKIKLTIREILENLIFFYGRDSAIDIELPEDKAADLLEYRGDSPMYLLMQKEDDEIKAKNIVIYNEQKDKTGKRIDELDAYYEPNGLVGNTLMDAAYNMATDFVIGDTAYKVRKIQYGQVAGERESELYYAGELVAAAGETVSSVLEKIKNMLIDYEYYFDLNGVFCFKRKPTQMEIKFADTNNVFGIQLIPESTEGLEVKVDFTNRQLLTAISNSPDIKNIKNDFVIWGNKKSVTGQEVPIHIRVAIDQKPETPVGVDWREQLYQEAVEYYAAEDKTQQEWKYRPYYTDLLGFWRTLYDPAPEGTMVDGYLDGYTKYAKKWEPVLAQDEENPYSLSELYTRRVCGYFNNTDRYCYVPWLSGMNLTYINYYDNGNQATNIIELYKYIESENYYDKILKQDTFDDNTTYKYKWEDAEGSRMISLREAAALLGVLDNDTEVRYDDLVVKTAEHIYDPYVYPIVLQRYTNTNTDLVLEIVARDKNLFIGQKTLYALADSASINAPILASELIANQTAREGAIAKLAKNEIPGFYIRNDAGELIYYNLSKDTRFIVRVVRPSANENKYPIYYWDGQEYKPYVNYLAKKYPNIFNEVTLYYQGTASTQIDLKNETSPLGLGENLVVLNEAEVINSEDEESNILPDLTLSTSTIGQIWSPWVNFLNDSISRNNLYIRKVVPGGWEEISDQLAIRNKPYYIYSDGYYQSKYFGEFDRQTTYFEQIATYSESTKPVAGTIYYINSINGTKIPVNEDGKAITFAQGHKYFVKNNIYVPTLDKYPNSNKIYYREANNNNPIEGLSFYQFNKDTTYYENNSFVYEDLIPQALDYSIRENQVFKQSEQFFEINENADSFIDLDEIETEDISGIDIGNDGIDFIDYEDSPPLLPFDDVDQFEVYYATNYAGEIHGSELERKKEFKTLQVDYDPISHWHKNVLESPESLLFWFDFIDDENLAEYSKQNIGSRGIVESKDTVKAIYYPDRPYAKYGDSENALQIPAHLSDLFAVSAQGTSAVEAVGDLLYKHTYVSSGISLTSIPIYDLEPNHLIKLDDGYYNIDKLTIPLNYNGTMSISATKLPISC